MEQQIHTDEQEQSSERLTGRKFGEKLVADEMRAINWVVKHHGLGHSAPQWTGFTQAENFIRACMDSHRALIEMWGGWRYHSPPLVVEEIDEEAQAEIQSRVLVMLNDLPAPTRKALASGLIPPPAISPVMKRRYAIALPGMKTMDVYLGGSHMVQVRNGQAIGRAVLAHIKKAFGSEHPGYLRVWERMFELLGHSWRTADPFAVTFSAAPSTFLRLGQMGENSCTKFGSDWAKGKKFQALMPNSVVALIYRGKELLEKPLKMGRGRVGKPVYRSWGIVQPGGWAVLSNHYLLPVATAAPLIAKALPEAIGLKKEPLYRTKLKDNPGWSPLKECKYDPIKVYPELYYANADDCVFGLTDPSAIEATYRPSIDTALQAHYARLVQTKLNVEYPLPEWIDGVAEKEVEHAGVL